MAKRSKSQSQASARRMAPIGLWISGAAVLAGLILLAVKLMAYIGIFSLPDPKYVNWGLWICLGLAVIGPALFTLLDPHRVREFVTGRQARHGSNAVLMLVSFVLILVVINAIVYIKPFQWDWTEDQTNSLAPETIDALDALPSVAHAMGFYTSRTSNATAEALFRNLSSQSNGKFTYEFVDPERNPALAQKYSVTRDGTVLLLLEDRQEMLTYVSEQDVTNALVRLMNPGQRTVYFLTGHGEYDISGSGDKSYSRVKSVLEAKNYTVKTLNLLAQNAVPEDALAIIIAGPTEPLSGDEIPLLDAYLAQGGSVVALLEPTLVTDTGNTPDPLVDYLATSWGVGTNDDLIIDTNSNQPAWAVGVTYGSHAITQKLQNIISFFPTSRSLSSLSAVENVQTTTLVQTSSGAWGETDFAALQNSQSYFDPTSDVAGPLTVAIAAENSSTQGRVVVIGDSDFASDTFFDQYANGDLLINSIDWAAEQEGMINLTSKQPTTRQLSFLSNFTMLLLAFSFTCLIPGLVAAGGVASWLVRRSRG